MRIIMRIIKSVKEKLTDKKFQDEALNFWAPLLMGTAVLCFCCFVMCGGLSWMAK